MSDADSRLRNPPIRRSKRRRGIRLGILTGLLLLEVGVIHSLRVHGWVATTAAGRWTLALLAAALPLAAGGLILLWRIGNHRTFRFNLRMLLSCMVLLSIFLSISVTPLIRARQARRGAQTLLSNGGVLKPHSYGDFDFDHPELFDHRMEFPVADDIHSWLSPLAGELQTVPRDRDVAGITIKSDAHIDSIIRHAADFSQLRSFYITGQVSDAGLNHLSTAAPRVDQINALSFYLPDGNGNQLQPLRVFRQIRMLLIGDTAVPEKDWLEHFTQLESLTLRDETGVFRSQPWRMVTTERINEISKLQKLKQLKISGLDFRAVDITALTQLTSLRFLMLWGPNLKAEQIEQLRNALPNCQITLD